MKKVLLILNNQSFTRSILRWYHVILKQNKWEPIIFSTVGNHLADQIKQMGVDAPTTLLPFEGLNWLLPIDDSLLLKPRLRPQEVTECGLFFRHSY